MKKKHLTGLIILASLSIPGCAENNTKDSYVNTGENIENNIKWYPVPQPADKPIDATIILPAARDYNSYSGVPLRVLFNNWVRDPFILNAPDEYYYMVGTPESTTLPAPLKSSPESNGWWYNDGIPLWRSKNLKDWETMGYVWTFEKDATWSKEFKLSPNTQTPNNDPVRCIWAPEIHYLKGTYWIGYSMNYGGIGILKSTSGKPEGPYVDIKTDGPLPGHIDVALFEDTDGTVYYLCDGYSIARMKDDMSGLAEPLRKLKFNPTPPWGEGINMLKVGEKHVWYNSSNTFTTINGKEARTYDCFSATSSGSIYGPYNNRHRAITYAGHNNIFKDKKGNWWSTQFHPQPHMEKAIEPALIPIEVSPEGALSIKRSYPRPIWYITTTEPKGNWQSMYFKDTEWDKKEGAFGNPEVMNHGTFSDVGSEYSSDKLWMRKDFSIDTLPEQPALFLRHTGSVNIWINEKLIYSSENNLIEYTKEIINKEWLQTGNNIIAVAFENKAPYSYIDIGLIDCVKP